jgi:L-ascorbate metabolism protein UlaG (beta-lactamase superfamily)
MSIQKVPAKNTILFVWLNPVDIKSKNLQKVDAILITHEHYDHLDPRLLSEIQKATNCTIIADSASAKKLKNTIPSDKLQETKPGDETKIGAVSVKTKKCNHPAQSPVTYIINSEDNVKVYHTADSLPFPELALMGQKEKFDIVFCTVGIAPGASPQTGFEIARLTKPEMAIPYHTALHEPQMEFAKLLKRELYKTACLIPEQNKIYQVSKKEVET